MKIKQLKDYLQSIGLTAVVHIIGNATYLEAGNKTFKFINGELVR